MNESGRCLNTGHKINLCVPRLETNDIGFIRSIFQKLNFGKIGKIDCIPVGQNGTHFKAFIHYKSWYNTENNTHIMERLMCKKLVGVVYSRPWYWRIRLAR